MSMLIFLLAAAAALVVLVHVTCVASRLSRKSWAGHPLMFTGISSAYALVCGGAVGIALSWTPAPMLLLLGVAGWIIFDRRTRIF